MINLLTFNTILGASKQAKQIWRERSAAGLSGSVFAYFFFYCLAFIIYGIEKGAINMVVAGSVFLAYIPTLLGMWRFGDSGEKKGLVIFSSVFATMPVVMAVLEPRSREGFLGVLLVGMFIVLIVGFEKFRRTPGLGNVNPSFSWAFLIAGVFWSWYSYTLGEVGLICFNAGMVLIMSATLVLYYSRKRKATFINNFPKV